MMKPSSRFQTAPGCRMAALVPWRRGGDAMAWLIVLAAGLFETGFAVLLKQSHGLTNLWPTAVSALKLVSMGLVLAGVAGLNLSGVTPS